MKYYELEDGSFVVVNEYYCHKYLEEDDIVNVIRLTKDDVIEDRIGRDMTKYEPGRVDNLEIRLKDKYGNIKHCYRSLEDLDNNGDHFTRNSMTKVFEEVFPLDNEAWDWDGIWYCEFKDTESFHAFRDEDIFYILHKESGTMISWYKHMGRDNTCNKDLSLTELKLFLLLLRKELVEEKIIKPEKGYEGVKGIVK